MPDSDRKARKAVTAALKKIYTAPAGAAAGAHTHELERTCLNRLDVFLRSSGIVGTLLS
jgi:hypothetical protein